MEPVEVEPVEVEPVDVELLEPVPEITSKASIQIQAPPEDALLVPVASMISVWLPEAKPDTEYTTVCAFEGVL